jgi:hypothetical protein
MCFLCEKERKEKREAASTPRQICGHRVAIARSYSSFEIPYASGRHTVIRHRTFLLPHSSTTYVDVATWSTVVLYLGTRTFNFNLVSYFSKSCRREDAPFELKRKADTERKMHTFRPTHNYLFIAK